MESLDDMVTDVLEHVIATLGDSPRLHVNHDGRFTIAASDSVRVISDVQIDAMDSQGMGHTASLHVRMKPFCLLNEVACEEIGPHDGSTLVLFGRFRFLKMDWEQTDGGYGLHLTRSENSAGDVGPLVVHILRHVLDKP